MLHEESVQPLFKVDYNHLQDWDLDWVTHYGGRSTRMGCISCGTEAIT